MTDSSSQTNETSAASAARQPGVSPVRYCEKNNYQEARQIKGFCVLKRGENLDFVILMGYGAL
jgi:hypothetical protein